MAQAKPTQLGCSQHEEWLEAHLRLAGLNGETCMWENKTSPGNEAGRISAGDVSAPLIPYPSSAPGATRARCSLDLAGLARITLRAALHATRSIGQPHMRIPTTFACIAAALVLSSVRAQTSTISAPTGQKTLAATLHVYAFPGAGQIPTQQSQDETECYNWGVQETGNDPFHIANQAAQQQQQAAQQQQQAQQSTSGSAVKGAVGGAAGGAIIGAIAGNAGKGAAIGAGVGAIGNRARAQSQANQSSQQATQQSQAAARISAAQMTDFKKAFSACLEAKKYTVRF
jgi:Glycine-zipper domain